MNKGYQSDAQDDDESEDKDMICKFVHEGSEIYETRNVDEDQDNQTAAWTKKWNSFRVRAMTALVLGGKDLLLEGCRECSQSDPEDLRDCAECGKFKTHHYECHLCSVMKGIYHI